MTPHSDFPTLTKHSPTPRKENPVFHSPPHRHTMGCKTSMWLKIQQDSFPEECGFKHK